MYTNVYSLNEVMLFGKIMLPSRATDKKITKMVPSRAID